MSKGPTWNEVHDPKLGNRIESRQIEGYKRKESRAGKTRVLLSCPFCQGDLWAYVWSLSGGGKRCDCGALAGADGTFHHFADRRSK